jgi:hypothetical protein
MPARRSAGTGRRDPVSLKPGAAASAPPSTALVSSRDAAPYSLSSRNCTTSNWSGPDGRQQRQLAHGGVAAARSACIDALLQQLVQALPELFELRRVRIVQVGERLRREARESRCSAAPDRRSACPRSRNPTVAHQPDDVARAGPRPPSRARCRRACASWPAGPSSSERGCGCTVMSRSNLPGADAQEGDAVAVLAGPCSPGS